MWKCRLTVKDADQLLRASESLADAVSAVSSLGERQRGYLMTLLATDSQILTDTLPPPAALAALLDSKPHT